VFGATAQKVTGTRAKERRGDTPCVPTSGCLTKTTAAKRRALLRVEGTRNCGGIMGIRFPWPHRFLGLNPVQNPGMLLRGALTRRFSRLERRPHSVAGLFLVVREKEGCFPRYWMGLIGCLKGFRLHWIHTWAVQSGSRILTKVAISSFIYF